MPLLGLVELAAVAGCPKIQGLAAVTQERRVRNWLWAEGGYCWRERPFISSTGVRAALARRPNASCWPLLLAELIPAGSTMHRLGKAMLGPSEKQGQAGRVRMCSVMASQGNRAGTLRGCYCAAVLLYNHARRKPKGSCHGAASSKGAPPLCHAPADGNPIWAHLPLPFLHLTAGERHPLVQPAGTMSKPPLGEGCPSGVQVTFLQSLCTS